MEDLVLEILTTAVFLFYPVWRIFFKAGLSPIFSLLVFIPGLGLLICALILVFARWSPKVVEENS